MARIGYVRVSTVHQNTQRQEYAMPTDLDKVFTDKASGKNTDRPQFQAMLDYVREGDTVYFESFSRVSRSLPDLLNTLDYFAEKGVTFVSQKENIDTTGATGKLIVSVLGAISAYEREINAERREYGYKKALDEKRVGRPKAVANQAFHDAVKLWKDGKNYRNRSHQASRNDPHDVLQAGQGRERASMKPSFFCVQEKQK